MRTVWPKGNIKIFIDPRDSADYSSTIRTYYLRIFCWALDRVIHAVYVVVCFLIKSDIGQKEWKQYLDGHSVLNELQNLSPVG